jgi:hypothetical protein
MGWRAPAIRVTDDRVRTIVCLDDPSIDRDAMGEKGVEAYGRTLDKGQLAFRNGADPVWYDVRPITADQRDALEIEAYARGTLPSGRVSGAAIVLARRIGAFAVGCSRVHGVDLVDQETGEASRGDFPRERWAELPRDWRVAIGLRIIEMSDLSVSEERASDVGKS